MNAEPVAVTDPVAKPAPVSLSQLIAWRLNDRLTYREIANRTGCSEQAVRQRLHRHMLPLLEPETDEAYRDHRSRVLRSLQLSGMAEMAKRERLQNASVRDLTILVGTMYDKERLEAGQSTSNIALCALVESLEREGDRTRVLSDVNTGAELQGALRGAAGKPQPVGAESESVEGQAVSSGAGPGTTRAARRTAARGAGRRPVQGARRGGMGPARPSGDGNPSLTRAPKKGAEG